MMRRRSGFTLVEIVIVITIIAILAAVTYPVFARARDEAHLTRTVSNMRQLGISLLIYFDENGDLPVGDTARNFGSKAITCDTRDHWRQNCDTMPTRGPMIGSFGYVRLVPAFERKEDWDKALAREGDAEAILLNSIFYGSRRVEPFQGSYPPRSCLGINPTCAMPDRFPKFLFSGGASARFKRTLVTTPHQVSYRIFNWPVSFGLGDGTDQMFSRR
jgi:prepilin-type N-terminal cleavage/methylation domain-containing protein